MGGRRARRGRFDVSYESVSERFHLPIARAASEVRERARWRAEEEIGSVVQSTRRASNRDSTRESPTVGGRKSKKASSGDGVDGCIETDDGCAETDDVVRRLTMGMRVCFLRA